ncbi:hypothetical protein [Nocardiopsis chromatogenes]|uniref:hypothetical protein n=1 Tax=Nocardiopsis chromatogenes TaxID=280239 RepID=UPI000477E634|nr:hypothetical protein [Nocardiopsis chromatogenes]
MTQYPQPPMGPGDPYGRPADQAYGAQQPYPGEGFPQAHGEIVPAGTGGWDALPQQASAEPVLTSIGDISVTQSEVITPSGRFPIQGAVWTVTDMSHVEEKLSSTGLVLTIGSIVLFVWFCGLGLLGLFFLTMKEKVTTGNIQVSVSNGRAQYATVIPARRPETMYQVTQQVNYVRSLSAM